LHLRDRACRLCWAHTRQQERDGDVLVAARPGQQLALDRLNLRRWPPDLPPRRSASGTILGWTPTLIRPVAHEQLALVEVPRDLTVLLAKALPEPPEADLAAALDALAIEHGASRGMIYSRTSRSAVFFGSEEVRNAMIEAMRNVDADDGVFSGAMERFTSAVRRDLQV
jgi:hypothetical protein